MLVTITIEPNMAREADRLQGAGESVGSCCPVALGVKPFCTPDVFARVSRLSVVMQKGDNWEAILLPRRAKTVVDEYDRYGTCHRTSFDLDIPEVFLAPGAPPASGNPLTRLSTAISTAISTVWRDL